MTKWLEGAPVAESIKGELRNEISRLTFSPRLGIVVVGHELVSERFVKLKSAFAGEIGAETRRYDFPRDITTEKLRGAMKDIVHEPQNRGVIVQLPLPQHIDSQSVLNAVTPEKDVDVLSARAVGNFQVGKSRAIPPVAGALKALFEYYKIRVDGMRVAILGYGRLVGQPLSIWFMQMGASVTVLSTEEQFDSRVTLNADIVVSGMGKPGFINGDCVKDSAIVVDVGTSESEGKIVGDVDVASVSKKAAWLTPEKGGVGPLTVAMVFQNLVTLT